MMSRALSFLSRRRHINYAIRLDGGYVSLSDMAKENGSDVPHEKLSREVILQHDGYTYIYLSNEENTPVEVFFDDFKVEHRAAYVVQVTDYGACGDVLRDR